MSFVNKILSIIAGSLLGICLIAGVLCFGYTLASSAVQEGIASFQEAIDTMVDQAREQLGEDVASIGETFVSTVRDTVTSS